ncbi:LysR family transcriptional regulator [Pseudoxanthomonas suwonensis]|uniref:LysR family transcriptional regulator n=1 Tax=Pseudoxanthomonas suwonensis TaxID=314722 RepID=UPI00138F23B8|nr:LysR family transcriptional regulator [Pseudoxanthomonas suwonensis]KAF1701880.1 LysR family transcriptional regulator [Pseudoxanthomonas suwonensis]
MDQLEHYRIFLRVAELGGFTRAADSLGLPKASVSTAVRRLEADLGTQLFHRTTRRVQLTGDGTLFLERCRDFLGEAEELQAMFRREPQQLSGRVRIGMSGGMARQLVLPRLGAFLEAHPGLQIELGAGERRVDVVREGYDCVVRTGGIVDPSLVARRLGLAPVVTCASPAYLERHGVPRTLDDLASHRLVQFAVAFGQKPEGFEHPLPGGGHATLELPGAVTVDNGEAYVGAALAGLGLIQLPRFGVREALAEGRLVEVLPQLPAAPMPVSLLYPLQRHMPRRVREVMDWLAQVLAEHLEPWPG